MDPRARGLAGIFSSPTYPSVQVVQDLDFHKSLAMEPLLVPDNLDSHVLSSLVVVTFGNLTKGSLAKHVQNLITEHDMVVIDDDIVSTFVIES